MTAIDDVRSKVDIVALVGEAVQLKKAGRNFSAVCPFHTERTPSFYVFPERQTWHCFGACATGGDIFSFVMRRERVGFGDALRALALRAGVTLPSPQAARERADRRQRSTALCRAAAMFFREELLRSPEAAPARGHLERRGLTPQTIEDFRLGFCPQQTRALERSLAAEGFTQEESTGVGLLRRREDGTLACLFRGRLTIPIMDEHSDYVGFGARALDDAKPKYLNSPQSDIFEKSAILYGIHRARDAIRQTGLAVIVEGYMDALMAHQHGFANVVASMGTALTQRQVAALTRLASRFVLALDPDAAGDEATLRSLEGSWRILDRPQTHPQGPRLTGPEGMGQPELRVMDLPRGKDPDEVIRDSPATWPALVDSASPVVDYVFRAVAGRFDAATAQGKTAITQRLAPLIYNAESVFEQNARVKKLAEILGEEENVVRVALGGVRRTAGRRPVAKSGEAPHSFDAEARDPSEEYCLATLLRYPETYPAAGLLTPEHFLATPHREIFRAVGQGVPTEGLRDHLDPAVHPDLDALLAFELLPAAPNDRLLGLEQSVGKLEIRAVAHEREAIQDRRDAGDISPEEAENLITILNKRQLHIEEQRKRGRWGREPIL